MKVNSYYLKARLFPTILTSIPLLVFVTRVLNPLYGESLKNIYSTLPVLTNLGIYAALVFLCVQVNRFVSKELFQKYLFNEESKMPTTNYLLWNNPYFVTETKKAIREKILLDFNITLLSPEEEQKDDSKARNLIAFAVSQIRNKLRENRILFQHNLEYGFIRNFIGGSFIAILFSIIVIMFALINTNIVLRNTGIILLVVYLLPILLSRFLISRYGRYYAKVLYEQFMTL